MMGINRLFVEWEREALLAFAVIFLSRRVGGTKTRTGDGSAKQVIHHEMGFSLFKIKHSVTATPADSSPRFQEFASGASIGRLGDRPITYYFLHRGYEFPQDFENDKFVCYYDAPVRAIKTEVKLADISENVVYGKSRLYFVCDDKCCEVDCCEINPLFVLLIVSILVLICGLMGYASYYCMKEDQVNLRKFSTQVRRYSTTLSHTLATNRPHGSIFDGQSHRGSAGDYYRDAFPEEDETREILRNNDTMMDSAGCHFYRSDPREPTDPYQYDQEDNTGKALIDGVYYQGEGQPESQPAPTHRVQFYENPRKQHYGAVQTRHFI